MNSSGSSVDVEADADRYGLLVLPSYQARAGVYPIMGDRSVPIGGHGKLFVFHQLGGPLVYIKLASKVRLVLPEAQLVV